MKKVIIFLALGLSALGLRAQTPLPLPGGSFEQWTSHPGYNVTVLFMPINVYGSYTTPTGWSHLSYPVNETTSLMGMTININTSVPLVSAMPDTAGAPDSTTAARLQTIMISDIVSSTVLSMAGDMIDSTLRQTVFPSILSIGEIDLVALMPLLTSALSDMGNIEAMLPSLLTMDVNDYVSGGLSLDGFRPGALTGNYKYQSATTGDNGGIVLVGTHYNPVTHRRDIVGAGASLSLTDTPVYTPFSIEYTSLADIIPGSPAQAPDSLIVLLLSSASQNMQQGSVLWVDNLVLWSEPDTCAAITGASAVADIHEAALAWSVADPADAFELEYGEAGFTPGSGTSVTTTGTTILLEGLAASTQYYVWLRTLCSDSIYGDWNTFQFTTGPDTCASVTDLSCIAGIHDASIVWNTTGTVDAFEVEYGEAGFAPGGGTTVTTTANTAWLDGLEAATQYDVHIRTLCADSIYGDWSTTRFSTEPDTCASVTGLTVVGDDTLETLTWGGTSQPDHWEVEYGEQGFLHGSGTTIETDETRLDLYGMVQAGQLLPDTWYDFHVRAVCDINGEWASVQYHTPAPAAGIDAPGGGSHISIYPNPANGMCTVSVKDGSPARLNLYSPDGRLVATVTTTGAPATLQLPCQGIHLLQAVTPAGISTHKIINAVPTGCPASPTPSSTGC